MCDVARKFDIIPVLTDIAKAAVKEKVIRIIIATFRVGWGNVALGLAC